MVYDATHFGRGGGLYLVENAKATLYDCTIEGNSAGYDGGGIFVDRSVTLKLYGSTVTKNEAYCKGGGLFMDSFSTVTLSDSTVGPDNEASGCGTSQGYGSGARARVKFRWHGHPSAARCVLTSSLSNARVAGIYFTESDLKLEDGAQVSGNTNMRGDSPLGTEANCYFGTPRGSMWESGRVPKVLPRIA